MLDTPAGYTQSAGLPELLQKVYFSGQAKWIGAPGWNAMTNFFSGGNPQCQPGDGQILSKEEIIFQKNWADSPTGAYYTLSEKFNANRKSVPEKRINPNKMFDVSFKQTCFTALFYFVFYVTFLFIYRLHCFNFIENIQSDDQEITYFK